ncbi:MAG: 2-hydroxychromene-2-carboxylate isomerase [Ferrovibrio sp.]|uniref:2-hydroxychromene-2-carboxylate isomerase n=1 Tax=Ferrovibrio sp. TaxID=1917215 RepID=UPI00391DC675
MAKTVDYYVFLASPWAYLGSQRFADIAKRHGASIRIIPMAAAEVFPVSGGLPLAKRAPQRQAYRIVELKRWREFLGVPLNLQPSFFPMNEALAARLVIAAREAGQDAVGLAHTMMRAVWAEDRNIADPEILEQIITETGLDPAKLFGAAESDAVQAEYTRGTQQAIDANVFGAPSYVIDGEIFWGQDRLDFVDRALAKS